MFTELTEQAKRDKSADRQANAWLKAFKARDPERVKAAFAKFPVLTDDADRQRREDAGLPSETLPAFGPGNAGDGDDGDDTGDDWATGLASGRRDAQSSGKAGPWIPTATEAKIQQRHRSLSDVDQLRAFLSDGRKPAIEVAALMPNNRLHRAKGELGIKPKRIGGRWYWELPARQGSRNPHPC